MPASTTRTSRKPRSRKAHAAHVVIDDTPIRARRKRPTRSAQSAARVRKSGKDYVVLPSWKELDTRTNGRVVAPKSHPFDSISTARIALLILVAAVMVTAYVGHVHATQGVLQELEDLRAERAGLRLEYNSVKGEYDRVTGPAEIRRQAREIGLTETTRFGPPVSIDG